jgi:predicted O-methyltransferase YrrM
MPMKFFWTIGSYIQYLLKSKSRYVIHSPFIYRMVQEAFLDKTEAPELKQLDISRKKLFGRTTTIETTDLGAGAGNKAYTTVLSQLGKLAKQRSPDKKNLHLIYRLVKHFKPENILEFGTAAGISASYIGKANQFKKFVTMEGCAVLASHARNYLNSMDLSTVEIKVGAFDVTLDKTLKEFEQLDFVFVDGNHRKHQTLHYFKKCLSLANDNSIFILDDIHWSPGMQEAWELIKENQRVTLTIDLFKIGIVFFRKEIAKQHMVIRY